VLLYYVMRRGIATVAAIDLGRARDETAGRRPRIGTKGASCRLRSVSPRDSLMIRVNHLHPSPQCESLNDEDGAFRLGDWYHRM
jgi:hypothetical protein